MKLNKIALTAATLVAASTLSSFAMADNNGEIRFTGQVVNSPCNIQGDSLKQEVSFGQLSRAALESGTAAEQQVTLKLVDCNFDEFSKDGEGKWVAVKDMKITFGGKQYAGNDKEFLDITGTASNIGIQIKNFKFDEAKSVMSQIRNQKGENILEFTAQTKIVDAAAPITEGNFSSVADFRIAYE